MSLEVKDVNIKIAKEDIICYKIVIRDIQSFNDLLTNEKNIMVHYISNVFGYWYSPKFNAKHVDLKIEEYIDENYKKRYRVSEGYHSYRSKEWIKAPDEPGVVLVECMIPKGTKYIEDEFGMYYVSETIKIVKEV